MGVIRSLFWFVLFVLFTFSFVVLFEYGTTDFVSGFQKEFHRVTKFVQEAAHPATKKKNTTP